MLNYRSAPLWILIVLAAVGCSSDKNAPVCHPVHGTVTSKGRPLPEAQIVLHPVGGDVAGNQKPTAIVKSDGTFELTTYHAGDGAPLGEYAITVELRALQTGGEEAVRSGPNTLRAKYAKPATSGVKYTVADGDNQIPTIDIK
jgi:hypothetical protein